MHIKHKAFTLVELIVVITILAILATIGFLSLFGYQITARDAVRVSDVQNLSKIVELYKLENGVFPQVTDPVEVTFSGSVIWKQGHFGEDTRSYARRISEVPTDPLTLNNYAYSTTQSTGEYQIGTIVEKAGTLGSTLVPETYAVEANPLKVFATTLVKGNYNGQFITHKDGDNVYVLAAPSILSNITVTATLNDIHTNNNFVYEGGPNAPATYSGSLADVSDWSLNPVNVTGDEAVIYEGTVSELNTEAGKIELVTNLKDYYAGTDVAESAGYSQLVTLDPVTNPSAAVEIANGYVYGEVGGLGNGYVTVNQVVQENTNTNTPSAEYYKDYSSTQNYKAGGFNAPFYPNSYAFTAFRGDGSIVSWGGSAWGGTGAPTGTDIVSIYPNSSAFLGLKQDGSIVVWGQSIAGATGVPTGTGFTKFASSRYAFAALKDDGTVVSWGDSGYGGTGAPTGTGFTNIYSTHAAFAALKDDGTVVSWGDSGYGGTGAPTDTGYTNIFASERSFIGVKNDGTLTTWGQSSSGNGIPATGSYTAIESTQFAFAGLKSDGSIDVWGNNSYGGSGGPSGAGFIDIFSTERAFAALKNDGTVVSWGDSSYGGTGAPTDTGYTNIFAGGRAFAALKDDGSIVTWGDNSYGGAGGPTDTGFVQVYSTLHAFTALKDDGTVVSWGNSASGGSGAPTGAGFTKIYSTGRAFAGLKSDGSIESWGHSTFGGTGAPSGTGFVGVNGGNY